VRTFRQLHRRLQVVRLLLKYGKEAGLGSSRGFYSRVARDLGVHRGTIGRDWRALREATLAALRAEAQALASATG
jgi:hypothetical protein